jgi:small-conductance mechanosensitive channel
MERQPPDSVSVEKARCEPQQPAANCRAYFKAKKFITDSHRSRNSNSSKIMITKNQALAKLQADPQVAAEFDAATERDHPGMSRDQAVDLTLKALNLKRDKSETLATLKKQSVALKAKLAELKEIQAAIAPSPRRHQATNPSPPPFIKSMSLEAFNAMTPTHRMKFVKSGGKII